MKLGLAGIRRLIHATPWRAVRLNHIIWFNVIGIGWYPILDEVKYDEEYLEPYFGFRTTEQGKRITDFRVVLVNNHYDGEVVDVGIGSGHFIDERGHDKTKGYDISQYGVNYLQKHNIFHNPFAEDPVAISCWDSLEHMKDCWSLIERVKGYVFLSVPICTGPGHSMTFKHFKPYEHWWYFTPHGILNCFDEMGFECLQVSDFEIHCGREDVQSYVFKRRTWNG